MKHNQIRALVKIAETGSMRSAATELNTSQSALTRSMRELEESLGAELLIRSYRGISFTPAGKAVLQRARMILATIDRAREEVQHIAGGRGASVSVAVTPVVASTALPDIYHQFRREFPEAKLTLTEGMLTDIIPRLLEGKLDFGIAIASQKELPTELVFTPLCDIFVSVAGRNGHPLAESTEWSEFKEAKWVLNLTLGSSSNSLLNWFEENLILQPKEIVQCTSPQIMLELMRRTDLVGFGPARLFTDPFSGTGVVPFRVTPLPPLLKLGLISIRGMALTTAAQAFDKLASRILMSDLSVELSAPI